MTADKITSLFILILLSLTIKGQAQDNSTTTTTFEVNLKCKQCESIIVNNFSSENGIKSIEVSLEDRFVRICYNPDCNSDNNIISSLEKLGYTASVKTEELAIKNDCGCDDNCFTSKKRSYNW